jgi:NhaA family Na+:H+ antiporter
VALWFALLQSGVHATIAGVLLAATIPSTPRLGAPAVLAYGQALLDRLGEVFNREDSPLRNPAQKEALELLEEVSHRGQTPLQRIEHALHPWVAYGIMPVFALANAGVPLGGDIGEAILNPVALGIVAGLVLGKQLGIGLAALLAVRTGLARLPEGVTARQVYGASWLGGIGFTMSLFIAGLAFGDAPQLATAKVGILLGSLISGVGGFFILWRTGAGPAAVPEAGHPGDVPAGADEPVAQPSGCRGRS